MFTSIYWCLSRFMFSIPGPCDSDEFWCHNGRCIDTSLRCNGYNPCGDKADCRMSVGAIAGIIVGAILGGVVFVFVIVAAIRCRLKRPYTYIRVSTCTHIKSYICIEPCTQGSPILLSSHLSGTRLLLKVTCLIQKVTCSSWCPKLKIGDICFVSL